MFNLDMRLMQQDNDEAALEIKEDTFMQTSVFKNVQRYLYLENELKHQGSIDASEIIRINPMYYDAYRIAGDEYSKEGKKDSALLSYKKALTLEIATEGERESIAEKIKRINTLR